MPIGRYCAKALSPEDDFLPMSSQIRDFFEGLTNETKNRANIEIGNASRLIKKFEDIGISSDAKEKLEEGIKLRNAGTYLNYRDAVYKAYISQKAVVDSLILRLSGETSKNKLYLDPLKKEFDRVELKLKKYKKEMIISAPFVFFGGISWILVITYYNDFLYSHPGSHMEKVGVLAWILVFVSLFCIPIFLYSSTRYLILLPKKKSYKNQSESLDTSLTKYYQIMSMVKSEKEKLNIDEGAEKLDPIEYEKYLLKTYG